MQKRSGLRRGCTGFTLMEVMIACLIVVIMGTFATVGYSAWLPRYRLKAAARELYSHMHRAKMTAIKGNGNVTITYSQDPDCYSLSNVSRTVNLADYGSGVKFQGPQGQAFSVPSITFNSRGRCNAGYAYLTDEKRSSFYRVGPSWSTGVIRFEEYVSGSWK